MTDTSTQYIFIQSAAFDGYALAASPDDNSLWLRAFDALDSYQQWTQEGPDDKFRMRNAGSGRLLKFAGGNEQPVVLAGDSDVPDNTGYFSWGSLEGWGGYAFQSFLDSGQNIDAKSSDGDTATTQPVKTRGWRHGFQRELTYYRISVSNAEDALKRELIVRYAPRIWLAESEKYFPASVDWAFPYLTRFMGPDGRYWLETKQKLSSPEDDSLPLFRGQPSLGQVPVYAFWVDKDGSFDITYFTYYGYNRGKEVLATTWGNHVSDWEHLTVRLDRQLQPTAVYYSTHSDGQQLDWAAVPMHDTHPIGYSAWGSHGLWPTAGNHEYNTVPPLTDKCSPGTAWDTWNNVESYDYQLRRGLGSSQWPVWMRTDYTTGGEDPSSPAAGPIYRWGNPAQGFDLNGHYQLDDGPSGPPDKGGVWIPSRLG